MAPRKRNERCCGATSDNIFTYNMLDMQVRNHYIMVFVGGVVACTFILWVQNKSLQDQLQSLKDEHQKLMSQVNDKPAIREKFDAVAPVQNHISEVIEYTKLKQKEHSLTPDENHKMIILQKRIGYEVDVDHVYERTRKVLNLMSNYLYDCKKLLIAIEAGNANPDEINKLTEKFGNEITKLRSNKSTNTDVGMWNALKSVLYDYISKWLLDKIKDLFIAIIIG